MGAVRWSNTPRSCVGCTQNVGQTDPNSAPRHGDLMHGSEVMRSPPSGFSCCPLSPARQCGCRRVAIHARPGCETPCAVPSAARTAAPPRRPVWTLRPRASARAEWGRAEGGVAARAAPVTPLLVGGGGGGGGKAHRGGPPRPPSRLPSGATPTSSPAGRATVPSYSKLDRVMLDDLGKHGVADGEGVSPIKERGGGKKRG